MLPSWHGCISDASLRCLMQRLRDISKGAHLKISETSPGRLIKYTSSEMYLGSLRLSHRVFECKQMTVILGLQTKAFFGYLFLCLRVFKYFAKLNKVAQSIAQARNLSGIFIQEKNLFRPVISIISNILTFSYTLLSVRIPSRTTSVVLFPLTTAVQRKDSI